MFNPNFFPTPDNVIKSMVSDIDFNKLILEPSAGKGNIVEYIKKIDNEVKIDCIEKDNQLKQILITKGFNVVYNDFLDFIPEKKYEYIIMNPPFNDRVYFKHFDHALNIRNGAEIRCLIPYNAYYFEENLFTIKENSQEFFLKKTVLNNEGYFIDLGNCFTDAERKTSIRVCLITVPKKESKSNGFSFKKITEEKQYTINQMENNQLQIADKIQALVDRYNMTRKKYLELKSKEQEISFYNPTNTHYRELEGSGGLETFTDNLRAKCWKEIINKFKFQDFVTNSVKDRIQEFITEQGNIPFTVENIESLLNSLKMSQPELKQKSIEESFDILTKHHKENRFYGHNDKLQNGWKTNDYWKVNKKCILPVSYNVYSNNITLGWEAYEKLSDIEKSLCFIAKKLYKDIENNTIESRFNLFSNFRKRSQDITRYLHWFQESFSLNKNNLKFDELYNMVIKDFIELIGDNYISKGLLEKLPKISNKSYEQFNYMTFKDYIEESDSKAFKIEFGKWYDSEFFRFKLYKKGSLHLEFNNNYIWQQFNIIACQEKNWLPKATV